MRDTSPFLVFNPLERKNDSCKSDNPTFYPFGKKRDTLPFLVFNSLERNDDPFQFDGPTFDHFGKYA